MFYFVDESTSVCCCTCAVSDEVGNKYFLRCQLGARARGFLVGGDLKGFHLDCELFVFGMLSAFNGFSISFYLK